MSKILLTGGHAGTTAIAVVEELVRRGKKGVFNEIYWIGPKSAIEGKNVPTIEQSALQNMGVLYHQINAGRVQLKFTRWTIPSILKIPASFIYSYKLLKQIKPDLILSFGGYAAFPVSIIGRLMGIPLVLHEQTIVVGRSSKIISFFANKIALSRNESMKYFPRDKCTITGNPVMMQIFDVQVRKSISVPPTIFFTCGSRGAKVINEVVKEILPSLLKKYKVIHLSGDIDYPSFAKLKGSLNNDLKERYYLYSVVDPMIIDNLYRQADIIVGRAGANTISEILITKRPSVLIPIPFSYMDEQTKNAEYAGNLGLVRIIKQKDLTPRNLMEEIMSLIKNYSDVLRGVSDFRSPDIGASDRLVDLLEETLS